MPRPREPRDVGRRDQVRPAQGVQGFPGAATAGAVEARRPVPRPEARVRAGPPDGVQAALALAAPR